MAAASTPTHSTLGPLPLVVGVTGHRDIRLEDETPIRSALNRFFEDLRRRLPHTPLLVMSALADGADRLAAHTALASGFRLIAILPMPEALYREDFTPDSNREFDGLLSAAEMVVELGLLTRDGPGSFPTPRSPSGSPALASTPSAVLEAVDRPLQYQRVGAFIARHSQILIALWDGETTGKIGGTAEVVRMQLEGQPLHPDAGVRSALDVADTGPVLHVVTPRASNPHPLPTAFTTKTYFPEVDADDRSYIESSVTSDATVAADPRRRRLERHYADNFDKLDRFNASASAFPRLSSTDLERSRAFLEQDLRAFSAEPGARRIASVYAYADVLAGRYQRWTRAALIALLGCAFLAILAVQFFHHGPQVGYDFHRVGFLLLYPLVLLVAFGLWHYLVGVFDVQNRYQDYRALAEGLRVQYFWRLAGMTPPRYATADHYLRRHKSELDWIRGGMRVLDIQPAAAELTEEEHAARKEAVLRCWVDDQRRYYESRARSNHARWRLFRLISWALLVLAILVALILAGLELWVMQLNAAVEPDLLVLSTSLLVLAGLVDAFENRSAYSEQAKQYERMAAIFARAHTRLGPESGAAARNLIYELGRESLAENADWVILRRGRPVDVPKGG